MKKENILRFIVLFIVQGFFVIQGSWNNSVNQNLEKKENKDKPSLNSKEAELIINQQVLVMKRLAELEKEKKLKKGQSSWNNSVNQDLEKKENKDKPSLSLEEAEFILEETGRTMERLAELKKEREEKEKEKSACCLSGSEKNKATCSCTCYCVIQ